MDRYSKKLKTAYSQRSKYFYIGSPIIYIEMLAHDQIVTPSSQLSCYGYGSNLITSIGR